MALFTVPMGYSALTLNSLYFVEQNSWFKLWVNCVWIITVCFWLLALRLLFPKLKRINQKCSNHDDARPAAKQLSYKVTYFKDILLKKESDRGLNCFSFWGMFHYTVTVTLPLTWAPQILKSTRLIPGQNIEVPLLVYLILLTVVSYCSFLPLWSLVLVPSRK